MYKLQKDSFTNEVGAVLRLTDNTSIPFDTDNTDYQEYLKWLSEGNTPEAAE
jgi:hypothetical protein